MTQNNFIKSLAQQHSSWANSFKDKYPSNKVTDWISKEHHRQGAELSALRFPTTKDENWVYTSLKNLQNMDSQILEPHGFSDLAEAQKKLSATHPQWAKDSSATAIHMINGSPVKPLGLSSAEATSQKNAPLILPFSKIFSQGLTVLENTDLSPEKFFHYLSLFSNSENPSSEPSPFSKLNWAFFEDGIFVYIPPGQQLETPVEINQWLLSEANPRLETTLSQIFIVVGEGASCKVIQVNDESSHLGSTELTSQTSSSDRLSHTATYIYQEPHSSMELIGFQKGASQSNIFSSTIVELTESASFKSLSMSTGGKINRSDLLVQQSGEKCSAELNGIYFAQGKSLVDNHTRIEHRKPHGRSRQLYKGILLDQSKSVFNGQIYIAPKAQKIDSDQMNRNLIFDQGPEVCSKPELDIHADDVKATHGMTVGPLNEEEVFYLQSRGMDKDTCHSILSQAFLLESVYSMEDQNLKEKILVLLNKHFPSFTNKELRDA